ncbi:MAG: GDSL-type esterase/lipase family protein [Muribaculaceae bacterium]|nr:GDSL-type esterase/lipase family protein [Muribaculaceae bacterium]
MKRFILFSISFIFLAAIFTQLTFGEKKIKDWADFGRYKAANSKILKPVDVVFMGNSITDHWDNNDSLFFDNNNFADRGISGQTSCEMVVRFRQDVIDLKPKAVVILAGINDIAENIGRISNKDIMGNIMSMCELATANGIKPILCSILPCDRFGWNAKIKPAERVKEMNVLIRKYAKENNFYYVDYHSALGLPNGALPAEIAPDGCHPNLDGYKVMEKLVLKGIAATLNTNFTKYYRTK